MVPCLKIRVMHEGKLSTRHKNNNKNGELSTNFKIDFLQDMYIFLIRRRPKYMKVCIDAVEPTNVENVVIEEVD